MKKSISYTLIAAGLLFLMTIAGAVTIEFNPPTQSIGVNSSVTVDVVISELGTGTAPSLSTFDLDISFDPAKLVFTGATFGDPILGDQLDLDNLGMNIVIANVTGPGVIQLFELSFDSPQNLNDRQANSFTLATVSFDALSVAGISPLNISRIILGDASGNLLIADKVLDGSIQVVNEPATVLLLCFGLVCLAVSPARNLIKVQTLRV